jgi:Cdc6-like AAA superfamily ATPase
MEAISQILLKLDVKPASTRGLSYSELLVALFESIKSTSGRSLLLFDDVDSLILRGHTFLVDLIPKLHEMEENVGNRIGIVFTSKVEKLIRDRFPTGSCYFIRLNKFDQSIISDNINWIVKYNVYKNYDGVASLRAPPSADPAELEEKSIFNLASRGLNYPLINLANNTAITSSAEVKLSRNQMAILKAISQARTLRNGYKKIGDVEKIYISNCLSNGEKPLGHTRIWKITKDLEAVNLVERRIVSLGRQGRTTFLRLSF